MRIAVCLSGQLRSFSTCAPSILRYFTNSTYEVDYFCHVWDYNTWKLPQAGKLDQVEMIPEEKFREVQDRLNPVAMQVGSQSDLDRMQDGRWIHWGSLFYSMMYANNLKREHEIKNRFEYDWVVKARYDLAFPPNVHFYPKVMHEERMVCFPYIARMFEEFRRINASDVLFYGDSWGMDIAADHYWDLLHAKKTQHDQSHNYGPGVLLNDYLYRNNVIIRTCTFEEVIVRREAEGLDLILNWEEIVKIGKRYYGIVL